MSDKPKIESTKSGQKGKPFLLQVQSPLGMELVDIVNVLRGLGTPEEQVVRAVWDRIDK
jgi:hypothetical protein